MCLKQGLIALIVQLNCLYHSHIGLVGLAYDALDYALADLGAIVINQIDLLARLCSKFDGEKHLPAVRTEAEDGKARATGDALHAAYALVEIDARYNGCGALGNRALLTGERARVAGESVQAVGHHEAPLAHAFRRGQARGVKQADRPLLGVDIFLGYSKIGVVVYAAAQGLLDFVGALAAAQHGRGALAYAHCISYSVAGGSKDLRTLSQQLAVRQQSGADVNAVNAIYAYLRAGNWLKVLALGDNCAHHSGAVRIGDSLYKGVARHDGYAEPAEAVGLHGEAAFVRHGFNDGLYFGSGLHGLVGCEVAYVTRAYGENVLSKQGELLVHHALEHGCGIYAREVVVLECRHKREGASGNHKLLSVNVKHLLGGHILNCQAFTLKDVPDHAV